MGWGIAVGLSLLGMYQQGQAIDAQARSQADIIAFNRQMLEMSSAYGTKIAAATGEFEKKRSENILDLIKQKEQRVKLALLKMKDMLKKITGDTSKFTDTQIEEKKAVAETFLTREAGYKTEDITEKEGGTIANILGKGALAEAQVGRKAQFQVIGAKTKTQEAIGKGKASAASQGVFVGSGSARDIISEMGISGAMNRYYAQEDALNSIKAIKDDIHFNIKSIRESALSEKQAVEFGKVKGTAGIRQEAMFAKANNDFSTLIKLQELDNKELYDRFDIEEMAFDDTNNVKGDALRRTFQIEVNNLSNQITNRAGLYGMNLQMQNLQQTAQNQVTGTYLTGLTNVARIGQEAGWFSRGSGGGGGGGGSGGLNLTPGGYGN